jgi:hypothetical protein
MPGISHKTMEELLVTGRNQNIKSIMLLWLLLMIDADKITWKIANLTYPQRSLCEH